MSSHPQKPSIASPKGMGKSSAPVKKARKRSKGGAEKKNGMEEAWSKDLERRRSVAEVKECEAAASKAKAEASGEWVKQIVIPIAQQVVLPHIQVVLPFIQKFVLTCGLLLALFNYGPSFLTLPVASVLAGRSLFKVVNDLASRGGNGG